MKILFVPVVFGMVLAGCASAPADSTSTAAVDGQKLGVVYPTGAVSTGHLLRERTTDRAVRVIGNQAASEDARSMQSIGNITGARGN